MEKFNGKTAIWGDQNEKYLRSVVLYGKYDNDISNYGLFYDEATEEKVYSEDLFDMYMKNVIVVKYTNKHFKPINLFKGLAGVYGVSIINDPDGIAIEKFSAYEAE